MVAVRLRDRRYASASPEQYFLAGRTLNGWQAGISMAATQFAADTPLLVTGLIAAGGIFAAVRWSTVISTGAPRCGRRDRAHSALDLPHRPTWIAVVIKIALVPVWRRLGLQR